MGHGTMLDLPGGDRVAGLARHPHVEPIHRPTPVLAAGACRRTALVLVVDELDEFAAGLEPAATGAPGLSKNLFM